MILRKFTDDAHQLGWECVRPLEARYRPPQVIFHILHVSGGHSLADGLAGGVSHHLLHILHVSGGHSLADGLAGSVSHQLLRILHVSGRHSLAAWLACGVSNYILRIFQLRRPRI
jgi:hypothetical protein